MQPMRGNRVLWGMALVGGAVWACETARTPSGFTPDIIPPAIALSAITDTQQISSGLSFTVTATDNLALNDVQLTYSGGYIAQTDTIFKNQTLTSYANTVMLTTAQLGGAGGLITIVGHATDGAGNTAVDTLRLFLVNIKALKVILLQPTAGAVASPGKYVPVQVIGVQTSGVQKVGWLSAPPTQTAIHADSVVNVGPPFPDSVNFVDSVLVTGTTGTFTIVAFAVDSGNRRATSGQVTVNILSAANDTTPPEIEQFVALRSEATDSITVHATDPSGISVIGFRVTDSIGTTVLHRDSVLLSGKVTDVRRTFSLGLFGLNPPVHVIIQAFACDSSARHNCGVTGATFTVPSPSGPARADTLLIVSGTTRPFPLNGSQIADAIFDKNRGELYLTNPALSRVEIFQVANTSFVAAGIPTAGPVPWGIALWPRDTLGNYGDSIVVANSGGTELSIIDVTPAVRQLRWRQDLPAFLVETYHVLVTAGGFKVNIIIYDLSSRPQYVATVCRPAGGTACSPDSIFALYSTTPTAADPSPFTNRATLRMEKLKNTVDTTQLFSHFFWELAQGAPSSNTDTLRVVLRRPRPTNQTQVVLSACAGVNVDLQAFALGDSTFARNSGNFTHGFFGEGGALAGGIGFARVMGYTTKATLAHGAPTAVGCATPNNGSPTAPRDSGNNDVDFGMSPAIDVRDFVSNTATRVRSIATNFNGLTNVARADSIYYLDEGLKLKAISPDSGIARGMDMNYNHDFAPSGSCPPTSPSCGGPDPNSNNRLLFAARFNGNIDVWDTFFGQQVGSIPIRDPIVGPLRVAKDALGNQLLFGITTRGLVMVRLPSFTNPLPARQR